ncbi:MAG TPA: RodZ domain-containing protein, partial [Pyrinomonadaceae bacterium]|nr:RodZ domain-containing protein [Pyrinomonadaceae bacterium]
QNTAQHGQAPVNPAAAFNIQIKAKSKVWVRTKADDGDSIEKILDAEETRDFTPTQRLSIQLSKANVDALEITINGRPAKIPAETRSSNLAEIVITRNDYERYLQ